jgi:hypothetical protein
MAHSTSSNSLLSVRTVILKSRARLPYGTIASWAGAKTITRQHQRPDTRRPSGRRTRPTINFQLACPSCRAAWTWRQNDTCLSSKTKEVSQVCSQRSEKSAHTYAKCALLCHFVLKRSAHGTFVHLRYQNDPKVLMECS